MLINQNSFKELTHFKILIFELEKRQNKFWENSPSEKNIERLLNFIPVFVWKMDIKFSKLQNERTYYSLSMPTNEQRDFFIEYYNKEVEEIIFILDWIIADVIQFSRNPGEAYNKLEFERNRNNIWKFMFPIIQTKEQMHIHNNKKIKWLGNSSQLGNIIYQFAKKGFIEFPLHNGETNYTGLAERVLNAFDFKDKIPSKKYLSEQINPESENNKLSDTNAAKLNLDLPYLYDLG